MSSYSDIDGQQVRATNENLYTLLFSEMDDRVVGLFACNILTAHYDSYKKREEQSGGDTATMKNTSLEGNDCQLVARAADEYRFVSEFLSAGEVSVRTDDRFMYVENALGQTLTYQGRTDALDGEYRTFVTVASGDYLPLAENPSEIIKGHLGAPFSNMYAYHSLERFELISPELVDVVDFNVTPVDFDSKTMVGHFMGKLNYLGPEFRIEYVIEHENSVDVITHGGPFWCDDGRGQPKGENMPYIITVINTYGKQINFGGTSVGSCE